MPCAVICCVSGGVVCVSFVTVCERLKMFKNLEKKPCACGGCMSVCTDTVTVCRLKNVNLVTNDGGGGHVKCSEWFLFGVSMILSCLVTCDGILNDNVYSVHKSGNIST